MKRLAFPLLLALAAFLCAAASAPADDALRTYVEVRTEDGAGGGVLVDHDGTLEILTCAHVTKNFKKVVVRRRVDEASFMSWEVVVARTDKEVDLALLTFAKPPKLQGARLVKCVGKSGDPFVNVGTPEGIHGSTRRGFLDSYQTHPVLKREYLLLDYRGTYGCSGSAVWSNGKCVGLVCRFWSDLPNSSLCAVPVNDMIDFLAKK